MKPNTHACSKTHKLSKESQQSGLSTNFQNIENVANGDVVTDDQTFVGLPTNFQNIINVANEDVVNDDQTWSKMWLEEKASIGTSKATKINLQKEAKSSLQ
jgi:hypothetical protein